MFPNYECNKLSDKFKTITSPVCIMMLAEISDNTFRKIALKTSYGRRPEGLELTQIPVLQKSLLKV